MKRHEALAPLSREHHGTLILAQLLKKDAPPYKDLPTEPKEKAEYARQQFELVIKKHFLKEEAMLEKVEDCNADIKELAAEIKEEHKQISALFLSPDPLFELEDSLDILGRALETHIRKEERVLFPMIQQNCPEELLKEIGTLLK